MDSADASAPSAFQIPYAPCLGEMVFIQRTLTCVTAVLGRVNGTWWVQTAHAPYTALNTLLANTGRTRVWAGRAFYPG